MTIKERARNFTEASKRDDRAALPLKAAMTGMSQKPTSSVPAAASVSPELDNQGKLDAKEQMQTNAVSEITLKPDGRDTAAAGGKISFSAEQPKDLKTIDTAASKTADRGRKPQVVETSVPAKGPGDPAEPTNNISQQSKTPRTGSRSKRRKSREPTSPISPTSENKPDCLTSKPEVTATKQEQVNDSETSSALEKVSSPSDKAQENASDGQSLPDNKQKEFKKDKQKKQLDSSLKKENIVKPANRQEPEPSVSKDEPDTAPCSGGTKTPIDKDAVILSQKEEKAGGHRLTQDREKESEDSRGTPASSPSPAVEQPIKKTPSEELEPPVKLPKLEKELSVRSEPKSKGKVREPSEKDAGQTQHSQHKDTELIKQAESKDVERLEKVEGEKTNRTEGKDIGTPQQLLHSDKTPTEVRVSDGGQGISGTERSIAGDDERRNPERKEKTEPAKDERKPETRQVEAESSDKTSDLPAQTQHARQAATTHPQKAAVCAVAQTNEEAASVTESDKEPSKGETATNAPTDLQTKSAESPGTETVGIAAEPQPDSVSVEKTENPPDDSCAHGANDAELASAKPITKATTAVEEVTVKAANETPQADSTAERASSVKEPPLMSASKSVSSKGAGQEGSNKSSTVKSAPSGANISGGVVKLAPGRPQCGASKGTESSSGVTTLKGAEKMAQRPSDSAASRATVSAGEKKPEKTFHSAMNELSPAANGHISSHPQSHAVKKETVSAKLSPTPKAPTSPEANKLIPDAIQRSSMKKPHSPRGLSKDDSATRQDAPSSWLDVDFPKRKLKMPVPKLSSSGSESNLLDTSGELDDDDFIEKIKNLCSPFSLPPRKHNLLRPPQPPFAMPAIKEDHFEKTFDPDEFKFGLRKQKFTVDTTPSTLAKLQNDTKSGLKPARASLADRSMLISSLDVHCRLKDKAAIKDEEDAKEEKDEQIKVKSRLEGSCVFSSLNSSILRGKKNGVQTQAEGTNSAEVSPSEAQLSPPPLSHPPTPSPTATAPFRDMLAKQSAAPSKREEAQAVEPVVSDSCPPLPSFNDIKLPDYLEKYLPGEPAKPVQSTTGREQEKIEVSSSVCYFCQLEMIRTLKSCAHNTEISHSKYLKVTDQELHLSPCSGR